MNDDEKEAVLIMAGFFIAVVILASLLVWGSVDMKEQRENPWIPLVYSLRGHAGPFDFHWGCDLPCNVGGIKWAAGKSF